MKDVYFQVTDGNGNEVFRITLGGSSGNWVLQDMSGNRLTVVRRIWNEYEIVRVSEVIATIRSVRLGRGKPKYEILLTTGTRLMASFGLTRRKFDVRSAEGEPFCRLERLQFSFTRRNVEVAEGVELVLAFSVIAWIIKLQEFPETV